MGGYDFIEWLGADMSIKILVCLDDPSDLIRFSAVSRCCREFVIANGICKQLFIKMFPEMSAVSHAIGTSDMIEPVEFSTDESMQWTYLKREHRVYAFLARGLASYTRTDCVSDAVSASSTDNYPQESIHNTLEPGDRIGQRASYWSSEGEIDPAIPETLTYKLTSKLCVVTEIHVQPFQAFFQFGFPIYSAKAVRFLMGHPKLGTEVRSARDESSAAHGSCNEKFVWTYVSPDFPMVQENCLQKFKLPEPVICIGGIFRVELLGRVQKQEMDGLYYTCISHVQVVGRPLLTAFDAKILDETGKCKLKYYANLLCASPSKRGRRERSPSRFHRFSTSIRGWEQMISNTLLGTGTGTGTGTGIGTGTDDNSEDENFE